MRWWKCCEEETRASHRGHERNKERNHMVSKRLLQTISGALFQGAWAVYSVWSIKRHCHEHEQYWEYLQNHGRHWQLPALFWRIYQHISGYQELQRVGAGTLKQSRSADRWRQAWRSCRCVKVGWRYCTKKFYSGQSHIKQMGHPLYQAKGIQPRWGDIKLSPG